MTKLEEGRARRPTGAPGYFADHELVQMPVEGQYEAMLKGSGVGPIGRRLSTNRQSQHQ
jgi:hypothetical protein